MPIPSDCHDGFFAAFWARPQAYLDPAIRAAMSTFAKLSQPEVEQGLAALASDLRSGVWLERYASLLDSDSFDAGYRLAICSDSAAS